MTISNSLAADAYHEAGHAVAAVVLGIRLTSVDIRPQRAPTGAMGRGGANLVPPSDKNILGQGETAVMPFLVTLLVGVSAEKLVNPDAGLEIGPLSDGAMLQRYAAGAICTPVRANGRVGLTGLKENIPRITALMCEALLQAERFVANYGAAIAAVAEALLSNQELTEAEVAEIVAAKVPATYGP